MTYRPASPDPSAAADGQSDAGSGADQATAIEGQRGRKLPARRRRAVSVGQEVTDVEAEGGVVKRAQRGGVGRAEAAEGREAGTPTPRSGDASLGADVPRADAVVEEGGRTVGVVGRREEERRAEGTLGAYALQCA
mgnify:CR=1 FL=1